MSGCYKDDYEAIEEEKHTIKPGDGSEGELEVEFKKYSDPENFYYCSMCQEFIPVAEDVWVSGDHILCGDKCKEEFLSKMQQQVDMMKEIEKQLAGGGLDGLPNGGQVVGIDENGKPIIVANGAKSKKPKTKKGKGGKK